MTEQTRAIRDIIDRGVREVAARSTTQLAPVEAAPVAVAIADKVIPPLLHVTNNEPWYQSRVTWGALGAIVLPLLGLVGVTTDILSMSDFVALGMAIGSAASGALTLYGRWKARKPIGMA